MFCDYFLLDRFPLQIYSVGIDVFIAETEIEAKVEKITM